MNGPVGRPAEPQLAHRPGGHRGLDAVHGPGRFVAGQLRARRAAVLRLLAWSALGSAPAVVSGRAVGSALDEGFLVGRTWVGVAWLAPMAVAGIAGSLAARRINPLLGEVVEPMRDGLVRVVVARNLRRAVRSGSDPGSGVVSQLVGQTESVRDVTASLCGTSLQALTSLLAATIGLASLDPVAAALVAAPTIATLALVAALVPTLASRTRALLDTDEQVARVTATTVSSVRDIVACGAERRAVAEAAEVVAANAAAARRMARAVAVRTAVGGFGAQAPVVLLLLAGPWLLREGRLTVGGLLGGVTYATVSLQPALRAAVETAAVSWVRLSVTLRHLLAPEQGQGCDRRLGTPPVVPEHRGLATPLDLRCEGLTFAYGPNAEPIVTDLDLGVSAGEHVAIVGPSGVGKSTLADLLVGLTAPSHGRVLLGGVPLDELDPRVLRRAIALVPQESYVVAGTVWENLTYLRPAADQAEVERAITAIGLAPVVERLGGHDAVVGGGDELSTGERQLLVLARVWLSTAAVVVLDEGTCHLDPAAEARVEEAFRRRPGTLVVVAHRISSARRADRIVVMDGGRVHTGRHDQLVRSCALYAELVGAWDGPAVAVLDGPRATMGR